MVYGVTSMTARNYFYESNGTEDSRKFRQGLYRSEMLVSHWIEKSVKGGFLFLIV